eukprot:GHRQ01032061.1.p1 GENE.GHRQ01032061.1~~GHRQ01032061.1.p1  ORF type:complete len:148 (-),score=0.40 GHRQ01032061.1:310-753(-)
MKKTEARHNQPLKELSACLTHVWHVRMLAVAILSLCMLVRASLPSPASMALVLCSRLTSKPDRSYVCLQVMQNDAAVFRTQSSLEEGCRNIDETVASFADVKVGSWPAATTSSCCVPTHCAVQDSCSAQCSWVHACCSPACHCVHAS